MDIFVLLALILGGLLAFVLTILAASFVIIMINPDEALDYTFEDDEI
jgi:hypothetical protein